MALTREEAAQALDDINRASDRIVTLKGYHHGAPFFILWGLVWLGANSISQFWPHYSTWAWGVGVATGMLASTLLGMRLPRTGTSGSDAFDAKLGPRIGATSLIMLAFIACIVMIARPDTQREGNAIISILFPFLYMAAGVWAGWRLFAIGLVTASAIIIGYFWIGDYFELWMGAFAGGSLIAGGIWLKTA